MSSGYGSSSFSFFLPSFLLSFSHSFAHTEIQQVAVYEKASGLFSANSLVGEGEIPLTKFVFFSFLFNYFHSQIYRLLEKHYRVQGEEDEGVEVQISRKNALKGSIWLYAECSGPHALIDMLSRPLSFSLALDNLQKMSQHSST